MLALSICCPMCHDNFLFDTYMGEEVQSLKTLYKLLLYCILWETKDFGLQYCRKLTTLKVHLVHSKCPLF